MVHSASHKQEAIGVFVERQLEEKERNRKEDHSEEVGFGTTKPHGLLPPFAGVIDLTPGHCL